MPSWNAEAAAPSVAVISDIHGNLPALEAVLREIDEAGIERVVVGGDVAGGPLPRLTVERLMALGDRARFVRGNGDREMLACFDGEPPASARPENVHRVITWCAAQMDRHHRDFIEAFVDRLVVHVNGLGPVLVCDASPRNDEDVFTERSADDEVRPFFAGVEERVVTCGHTHMQFERDLDGIHVVNVGSVGMPYGGSGAFWAVLGPEVVLRQTAYDLERAAELVRRTDFPLAGQFADRNVLSPPSADEAFDYMRRMAERQS